MATEHVEHRAFILPSDPKSQVNASITEANFVLDTEATIEDTNIKRLNYLMNPQSTLLDDLQLHYRKGDDTLMYMASAQSAVPFLVKKDQVLSVLESLEDVIREDNISVERIPFDKPSAGKKTSSNTAVTSRERLHRIFLSKPFLHNAVQNGINEGIIELFRVLEVNPGDLTEAQLLTTPSDKQTPILSYYPTKITGWMVEAGNFNGVTQISLVRQAHPLAA